MEFQDLFTYPIPIKLVRSSRKSISIELTKDCIVVVRVPYRTGNREIVSILEGKRSWIEKNYEKMLQKRKDREQVREKYDLTDDKIRELAQKAVEYIPTRVAYYASQIGVTYGRITIRNQKTRWGSCSSKGNLNFNCLLMLAPPEVLDYVVVHELCHRKQMNHSKKFWSEVEKILPQYKEQERWLQEKGSLLLP